VSRLFFAYLGPESFIIMTLKVTWIIILYIFISFAALLFILWIIDFSQLNIPRSITALELKPYGLLVVISFILVFIFLQKQLLRSNAATSIWKLIIASTVVSFISFFLYQAVRQLIILRGQYSYDLSSVLLSSIVGTIVSVIIAASIAMELKKIKGIWRHIPTVLFLIMLLLIKQYAHKIEW
jgi:hypothetical protein